MHPPRHPSSASFARSLSFLSARLKSQRNDISNAEALVIQDASAEVVIRTALATSRARTPHRGMRFPELIEQMRAHLPSITPYLRALEQLHEARNAVQHRLIIPAESQVEQFEREAISAIRGIIEDGIGIPVERVSLSELFVDPLSRELSRQAEQAYWAGDYDSTIVGLVACFEYGQFREQQRNWGSGVTLNRFSAEVSSAADGRLSEVTDYLKTVQSEVEVLKLGLDYKEYRRFADIAFGLLKMDYALIPPFGESVDQMLQYWRERLSGQKDLNGSPLAIGHGIKSDLQAWLGFALRFVARSTLTWQQTGRTGFDELLRGALERLLGPTISPPSPRAGRAEHS